MQKPNLEVLIKKHTEERERLSKLDAINDFYKSLIDSTISAGGCVIQLDNTRNNNKRISRCPSS